MKVTSINAPPNLANCGLWWGTAIDGDHKFEWFYDPECLQSLQIRREEPSMPRYWTNIKPAPAAATAVRKAVRAKAN
jgi:hypothetical protein